MKKKKKKKLYNIHTDPKIDKKYSFLRYEYFLFMTIFVRNA